MTFSSPCRIDIRPGAKIYPVGADGSTRLVGACIVVDGAEGVPVVDDTFAWPIVKMDDGEEYAVPAQAIA